MRTAFLWKRMWVIHEACQAEKYISYLHVCERERERERERETGHGDALMFLSV